MNIILHAEDTADKIKKLVNIKGDACDGMLIDILLDYATDIEALVNIDAKDELDEMANDRIKLAMEVEQLEMQTEADHDRIETLEEDLDIVVREYYEARGELTAYKDMFERLTSRS